MFIVKDEKLFRKGISNDFAPMTLIYVVKVMILNNIHHTKNFSYRSLFVKKLLTKKLNKYTLINPCKTFLRVAKCIRGHSGFRL